MKGLLLVMFATCALAQTPQTVTKCRYEGVISTARVSPYPGAPAVQQPPQMPAGLVCQSYEVDPGKGVAEALHAISNQIQQRAESKQYNEYNTKLIQFMVSIDNALLKQNEIVVEQGKTIDALISAIKEQNQRLKIIEEK